MYAYDIEASTRHLSLSELASRLATVDIVLGVNHPQKVQEYAAELGERIESAIALLELPLEDFKRRCSSSDLVHLAASRFGQAEIACIPAVQAALREHARCYVWSVLTAVWREYLRHIVEVIDDTVLAGAAATIQATRTTTKVFFISTRQGLLVQAQCGQGAVDKIQAEYGLPLNPFLRERFGELMELVEQEAANVLEEGTAAITSDPTEEGGIITVQISLT